MQLREQGQFDVICYVQMLIYIKAKDREKILACQEKRLLKLEGTQSIFAN